MRVAETLLPQGEGRMRVVFICKVQALLHPVITPDQPLILSSAMADNGVIFSDGMEMDYLAFNAGAVARIEVAGRRRCWCWRGEEACLAASLRKNNLLSFRNEIANERILSLRTDVLEKPKSRLGRYVSTTVGGEITRAFVPPSLPPVPPLQLDEEHYDLLEKANRALGRLDGMAALIPDTSLFIYFYVRKEALLSSQIEGTQSSFSDLLLFESKEVPGVPLEDVQEVSNYVAAMNHGLKRLRQDFPLSLRLIKEMHGVLLSKGRGAGKSPGEFRRTQNWIGGSRPGNAQFVPPPPDQVLPLMGDLEKFLHDQPVRVPLLIKAALAHVQFETIHPFLDGNGRLGRLLITLLLCAEEALNEPILYLSLYFKTHRNEYYERLDRVRTHGDWEGWLKFFLAGVLQTAEQATAAAKAILRLLEKDKEKIETLGRASASILRLHHYLQGQPITTVGRAAKKLKVTEPTVRAGLAQLEKLKIVRELTGRQRNRLFVYDKYLAILDEGARPIASRKGS